MTLHPVLLDKLNSAVAEGGPPPLTRRDARLPGIPGKVHAVIGMRRAGKTTFLRQLQADRRAKLAPHRAIFFSFDDDRLAQIGADQLSLLLDEYYRRYPELRGRETVYWFLDEIQLVPGWERFVRRVMDTERVEIVVSGSSARMLSREVHTSLRGRGVETVITPFSFREFLRHRGEEPVDPPRHWTAARRSQVERRFREFLGAGGFPEAQRLSTGLRIALLQGYVDTVLFRDIIERYGVTQVAALRWLTRHCLRNPAGPFSAHRLHQDLKSQGHGVAKDGVHAMLAHLVDAFLIDTVSLATESERRRNSNPRKVYPADPGLIGAFDTGGRANIGHALETAVFNEFARRNTEVQYVKTADDFEVDFRSVDRAGAEHLVQVCADMSVAESRAREFRALASAGTDYPRARQRVLTLMREDDIGAPRGITVRPAYEWLLSRSGPTT